MADDADDTGWETVKFVFRPLPDEDGVPVGVRVRRLLRYALRACGLKCVRLEEIRDDEVDDQTVQ